MEREQYAKTHLMYAPTHYERVFGQPAAIKALECLMRIVKESMAQTAEEQERSLKALENAQPLTGAIH
jgi:hypothetical protein